MRLNLRLAFFADSGIKNLVLLGLNLLLLYSPAILFPDFYLQRQSQTQVFKNQITHQHNNQTENIRNSGMVAKKRMALFASFSFKTQHNRRQIILID